MTEPFRPDEKLLHHTLQQALAAISEGECRETLQHVFAQYEKVEKLENLQRLTQDSELNTHKSLIAELKLARDQAELALKVKSEFVANVSHELRTPLNGILGMVEILLRGELNSKSKDHVATIGEAGASLLRIINDILDFSKIEAGKMELSSCQFDPLAVVEGVAEILVPQAAAKNLLLLATVDRAVPDLVYGDPQRLRQVLVNLCGNAIKFTDQGQIVIKVEVVKKENAKDQLLFSVCDSGIGISEQFQNRLFEPFMQAEGSSYRSSGGTGLGLSISKHLVELMGGKLFVESKKDIGSEFNFSIPLKTNTENSQNNFAERAWEVNYANMRILTLEPSHAGQSAICAHLCALGIAAQSSNSVKDALKLLESKKPSEKFDAILLDTVRFQEEYKEFLELFKRSNIFGLVNIIEVAAPESFTQERSIVLPPRTSHLAIPLRRKKVAACLDNLKGWKPKTRTPYTQTIEADCVPVQNQLNTIKMQMKIDESLVEKPKPQESHLRRALVADDNKINQQVASLFLQDLGFIVDLAEDGTEAVSAFKSKPYDMVFLDCQMPVLDGFEACKIIKEIQQRRGQRVPVIAVTANAIEGSREECLSRGMDDYLSKPIDPKTMSRMVARWLGAADLKITILAQESTPQDPSTDLDLGANQNHLKLSQREQPLIDLMQLRLRFNAKNMHHILRLFRDDGLAELAEIKSLIENQDMIGLQIKAHGMVSACNIVCAPAIARICLELEKAAMTNAVSRELVEILQQQIEKAGREIESELLQQSTTG